MKLKIAKSSDRRKYLLELRRLGDKSQTTSNTSEKWLEISQTAGIAPVGSKKSKRKAITKGRGPLNIVHENQQPGHQDVDIRPYYDFSELLVHNAKLPAAESDYGVLQHRFGRMLGGSFEHERKQYGLDMSPDAWDEYIFDSIQEYGPLVLLSRSVVRRVFAWQFDVNCIPKLVRLGKELAKAAQVRHRSAKGRISRKHVAFKRFVIKEISFLRKRLVAAWPKNEPEIHAFITAELKRPDCSYPKLARNIPALLDFLSNDRDVAIRFRGTHKPTGGRTKGVSDDVGPARFINLWIAYAENKTEDSVRQELWRQAK